MAGEVPPLPPLHLVRISARAEAMGELSGTQGGDQRTGRRGGVGEKVLSQVCLVRTADLGGLLVGVGTGEAPGICPVRPRVEGKLGGTCLMK